MNDTFATGALSTEEKQFYMKYKRLIVVRDQLHCSKVCRNDFE